ncbi:jg15303 [Pararge aegeria aegeria]|uniref:Jg15303 protein n=1 Tax=Pararge aegeria aegeria TaxID=348720 RepID=A0A8S4RAF4_9NEOP|nr:jg15303 [Pararge aegeria aegeria]
MGRTCIEAYRPEVERKSNSVKRPTMQKSQRETTGGHDTMGGRDQKIAGPNWAQIAKQRKIYILGTGVYPI